MSCPDILATIAHSESARVAGVLGCALAVLGISFSNTIDVLRVALLAISIVYVVIKLAIAWLKLKTIWQAAKRAGKDDHDTDEFL